MKTVPRVGCVSQDSEPSRLPKGVKYRGNPRQKRRVRFSQSALRQAVFRENKGTSRGKIHVKNPHKRSPHAVKFEDRSQEETERQQRCARGKAWDLAKKHIQVHRKTRLHSTCPRKNGHSRLRQQKCWRKDSLW